jgi:REP element-mobilizing transposase RayT
MGIVYGNRSRATGLTAGVGLIAFHLIVSAYGFWLPNDPRGSWSDFVASWELLKFGPATKATDRRSHAHDSHHVALRRSAKEALKYPPVRFNDAQRRAIAEGFGRACATADYRCLACCIGHDHAHLVIERHPREITVIAGHLKADATRALAAGGIHPLTDCVGRRGGAPTPWSEGCWKVFIDAPAQRAAAIDYVTRHPEKKGLPAQSGPFLTPPSNV